MRRKVKRSAFINWNWLWNLQFMNGFVFPQISTAQ